MKIVIMGYSGSGKSTLARKLGGIYGVEVFHFDTVHFLPDWEIRSREEKERLTRTFMDTHDGWVMDGNYSKLYYERRLKEADLIILLLFNRFACLSRAAKRYRRYRNTTRPDMAAGCKEKLDWAFVRWILHDGRTKEARTRYRRVMESYPQKVIVVRNQHELDACTARFHSENILS